jgi:polar amino acid transport system substrate-binding protein
MILSRPLILLACLAAACAPAQAAPMSGHTVAVCDDENELPPFTYYERQGQHKTAVLSGFAVAVIGDIFSRRAVAFSIDMKPWTRCLAVSVLGKQYGMIINMTYSVAREKNFLFSRPFYSATSYYYYSKSNHPLGLSIHSPADLHSYRVCGIQGHNYEGYGLAAGEVDQGAKNIDVVIGKLKLGRCALFVEKDEIMNGFTLIGKPYLADPDIGKAPVPGLERTPFYFGVSRRQPRAEELRKLVDEELLAMEASGKLADLWSRASKPSSTAGISGGRCRSAAAADCR